MMTIIVMFILVPTMISSFFQNPRHSYNKMEYKGVVQNKACSRNVLIAVEALKTTVNGRLDVPRYRDELALFVSCLFVQCFAPVRRSHRYIACMVT